jgi:tripartite-type tricarboxylate transporter receptor subunit TctC
MSIDRRHVAISVTVAAMLSAAAAVSGPAEVAVEAFYSGRQVNLIVGYGPGGGYDLTARLVARHIGRFIPGHPSVVVQNMVGAGSLRAANYLYGAAGREGGELGGG